MPDINNGQDITPPDEPEGLDDLMDNTTVTFRNPQWTATYNATATQTFTEARRMGQMNGESYYGYVFRRRQEWGRGLVTQPDPVVAETPVAQREHMWQSAEGPVALSKLKDIHIKHIIFMIDDGRITRTHTLNPAQWKALLLGEQALRRSKANRAGKARGEGGAG
jgi:hypothetical protein